MGNRKTYHYFTPDEVARIRLGFDNGESGAAVARAVGGSARNVAKYYAKFRAGIVCQARSEMRISRRRNHVTISRVTRTVAFAPPVEPPIPPRMLSLLALNDGDCKWPVGDPRNPDFGFCGLPSIAGKPYCPHHNALAWDVRPPKVISRQSDSNRHVRGRQ